MQILDTIYRLQCDACGEALSPTAENYPEAKRLARHIGWLLHSSGQFCVECVARLDAAKREELLLDSHREGN